MIPGDTPKNIYLSGPMTGYQDFNHGAFNQMAHKLRQEGHSVWNPAELFDGDTKHEWHDFMFWCLRALLDQDVLLALPGWNKSVGARLEVAVAIAAGIDVLETEIAAPHDRRLAVAVLIGMDEVFE